MKKLAALLALASCSIIRPEGPLSPCDLPKTMVCAEFLIGETVATAICAGTQDDLSRLENRYLSEHSEVTRVRRTRP